MHVYVSETYIYLRRTHMYVRVFIKYCMRICDTMICVSVRQWSRTLPPPPPKPNFASPSVPPVNVTLGDAFTSANRLFLTNFHVWKSRYALFDLSVMPTGRPCLFCKRKWKGIDLNKCGCRHEENRTCGTYASVHKIQYCIYVSKILKEIILLSNSHS